MDNFNIINSSWICRFVYKKSPFLSYSSATLMRQRKKKMFEGKPPSTGGKQSQ